MAEYVTRARFPSLRLEAIAAADCQNRKILGFTMLKMIS
jgi:hypothetical protein